MHKFVSACVFVSVLIVTPFSMKLSFTVWIKNSFILKTWSEINSHRIALVSYKISGAISVDPFYGPF